MKHLAALVPVALLAITLAFASRVYAQDLTPGEARATRVVAQAQERAAISLATDRAPTLTPTETRTPRPTVTETNVPTPTPTPVPTSTPQPSATQTPAPVATSTPRPAQAVVVNLTVYVTVEGQTVSTGQGAAMADETRSQAPAAPAAPQRNPSTVIGIVLVFAVLCGGALLVFQYSKRLSKS